MIQYSDESLESRWYREHSIRIHMKRLKDIKTRNFSIDPSPTRFYSVNRRKNRFKQNEMIRENIVLYDKLTQISERRKNKSGLQGPKSLNISLRKKEADRIIQDNFEFVKRLTEKESMFSVKKLRKEFDVQEKYKSSISRHNLHERLKKITDSELKLPPINQEYVKGASTSRVSNHSKTSKSGPKNEKTHSSDLNEESSNNEQTAKSYKKIEKAGTTQKNSKLEKKTEIKTEVKIKKKNEQDLKSTVVEHEVELNLSKVEEDKKETLEKQQTPKNLNSPLKQEENPLLMTEVDPDLDSKASPLNQSEISVVGHESSTIKDSDLPDNPLNQVDEVLEDPIENS